MDKIEILANALTYIEENMRSDIRTEDVAMHCYCSKSTLEKIFRCVNNISVRDYLIRRRMMLAAKAIISQPETGLMEIALNFGYSTNESFSRAFKSVWNCNPSEFRSNSRFTELYPRKYPPVQSGGAWMKKNVDISELYELFKNRKNCYFVCGDIKSLIPINEISRKAGDLAILEAMNRMEREAGDEDVVFRIGGDEFVILTDSEDISYAEGICERIKSYNGQSFAYEDRQIPMTMYATVVKFGEGTLKYRDLFEKLHTAIDKSK
ncbi:MAG: helix-turn-helix domain-containing protein [Lachnospiraceae bacterium]|nr:helix-turn-helix domain-containing protein [Lachnospiraceae bacterium]